MKGPFSMDRLVVAGAVAAVVALYWWGGTPPTGGAGIETVDPGIAVTRDMLVDLSTVLEVQSACFDIRLNGKTDDGSCQRLQPLLAEMAETAGFELPASTNADDTNAENAPTVAAAPAPKGEVTP